MIEYVEDTNGWKIFGVVVLILILVGGIGVGGYYLYKHYKQTWQDEAYKSGLNNGATLLAKEQTEKGVLYFISNNTVQNVEINKLCQDILTRQIQQ